MSRARTLSSALYCLPLALFVGCTGAVTTPDASTVGVRPTVEPEVEPTAKLYATADAAPASTPDATGPAQSAGTPEATTAGTAAVEGTGRPAPANAVAAATSDGAPAATSEATASLPGSQFNTPETQAMAAAIRETPRIEETPAKPLSAEERAARGAQPVLDLTFDDLKFEIEKDAKFDWSMTTEKMQSMRGRRVRLRGWIHPFSAFSAQVADFVFVRDNQECCFGPGAAVFDCVQVTMAPAKLAKFSVLPIAVEGVIDLDPVDIDGVTRMLYRLDEAVTR